VLIGLRRADRLANVLDRLRERADRLYECADRLTNDLIGLAKVRVDFANVLQVPAWVVRSRSLMRNLAKMSISRGRRPARDVPARGAWFGIFVRFSAGSSRIN